MRKAVQLGAGNIGRGFIGQLFSLSSLEVAFIEVDLSIVGAMNADRRYPVRVVSESGDRESYVENVRAVSGLDAEAAAREIVDAAVVGTAVGANILPRIAPTLALGLRRRWEADNFEPLNVILCENLAGADEAFRSMVAPLLEAPDRERLGRLVGFARASVGRMVPVMTEAMREGNPLRIWVEAYDHLQVDADAFVGEVPALYNVEPVRPFELYVQRKLYIHNMGHAAVAYLGALSGYSSIWEAVSFPPIARAARRAMLESAAAIAADQGVPQGPLEEHVEELLGRFANRKLGDTIERVGRDLPRKLAPRDRLVGSLELCAKHGLPRDGIREAMVAALLFKDSFSTEVADRLAASGAKAFLELHCGLPAGGEDVLAISSRLEEIKKKRVAV
jgi:mannitol-1-phosphate 5-dehydrogenase